MQENRYKYLWSKGCNHALVSGMKYRLLTLCLLPFLCLYASLAHAQPVEPQTPHWSEAQVERLVEWLEFSRDDALNISDDQIAAIRAAQESGDGGLVDGTATGAAKALLHGYRKGCCDASLRTGWRIKSDTPALSPEEEIVAALTQNRLDQMFIAAKPRHPFYRALRKAYAQESEPMRRAALAANMDRWRWMPRKLGTRYLLVNAASFEATLWEGEKLAGRWAVIVGKTRSPTPVFQATVEGVIFNPWWEIPSSIAAEGIAAMVNRNPAAAAKKGYIRQGGRYRQKPGPNNALGRMKLVMPNPYSVYLHDTPAKALFERDVRAFSHGCVRVGGALDLATTLLSDNPDWNREKVDAVVASRITRKALLTDPIPVYVAYFTAEPDDDGMMRFFPDIYRRDTAAVSPDQGKPCG